MFFWSHPRCFGSLGKFQHNIKISIRTARVSRQSVSYDYVVTDLDIFIVSNLNMLFQATWGDLETSACKSKYYVIKHNTIHLYRVDCCLLCPKKFSYIFRYFITFHFLLFYTLFVALMIFFFLFFFLPSYTHFKEAGNYIFLCILYVKNIKKKDTILNGTMIIILVQ